METFILAGVFVCMVGIAVVVWYLLKADRAVKKSVDEGGWLLDRAITHMRALEMSTRHTADMVTALVESIKKVQPQLVLSRKIELLLSYYNNSRGVGHSMLLVNGARNTNGAIILVANSQIAVNMRRFCPDALVIPWSMSPDLIESLIAGQQRPMIIDNSAMVSMLYSLMEDKDGHE